MQDALGTYPNLTLKSGSVEDLIIDRDGADPENSSAHGRISGVRLESGEIIRTNHVIITTGTFLGGTIFIGISPKIRVFFFSFLVVITFVL